MNEAAEKYLVVDYETRSEADLKKVGSYEYSNHPTTKILCVAWRLGTREELRQQLKEKVPAKIWSPAFPQQDDTPFELQTALRDHMVQLVAHNALFEQAITRFVLLKEPAFSARSSIEIHNSNYPTRWVCTAALAAALALPRNLEGACNALGLPIKKDMDGRRLMLKLSKPRKLSKHNKNKWHNSARDLRRIMQYCQNDVDAETLLFLTCPPLEETERRIWLLDQKINFRGFQADRELVNACLKMISEETIQLDRETARITNGMPNSTTQRDGVLRWLGYQGVFFPDLRAKTVADALATGLVEGNARRLLQIRQAISKTSTAKFHAFESRSRTDGRVRDILVYHTASTGRWGGSGIQPQNFPRGTIDDTTLAADVLRSGDLEFVRLVYGDPMGVFSSCLRAVITAPQGRELFCADYAAIEARVLFWVAGHTAGIKAFIENSLMYEELAMLIFNIKNIAEVTHEQRWVGKSAFLGSGYMMGWKKFIITCKNNGRDVSEEIAQAAINAYRSKHAPVVKLWSNMEKAALAAVQRKGTKFTLNKTQWWVECLPGTDLEFLWCKLPSGRRLAYFGPQVKYEMTHWGEKRPKLYHYGVNPLTRKWELSGTYGGKLTENVVQAIARDLMRDAMLRVEEKGYDIVLTVHDELLAERDIGQGRVEEFESLMAEVPEWAKGCPVQAKGWKGLRYKK